MHLAVLLVLVVGCAILLMVERRGVPVTLSLSFKGDVKRESRFLAQYGQSVCTAIAVVLVLQLDPSPLRVKRAVAVAGSAIVATVIATIIKRLVGRVRPARENAGKFLGPSWRHANYRESFPSSHSASAVGMSAALAMAYPTAAATFWVLAIACAVLRYLLDAHWPSDVLGGVALGYATALAVWQFVM